MKLPDAAFRFALVGALITVTWVARLSQREPPGFRYDPFQRLTAWVTGYALYLIIFLSMALALHTIQRSLNPTFRLRTLLKSPNLFKWLIGTLVIAVLFVGPITVHLLTNSGAKLYADYNYTPPLLFNWRSLFFMMLLFSVMAVGEAFLFAWFSRDGYLGDMGTPTWKNRTSRKDVALLLTRGAVGGLILAGFLVLWFVAEYFVNTLYIRMFEPATKHYLLLALCSVGLSVGIGTSLYVLGAPDLDFFQRMRGAAVPAAVLSLYVAAALYNHETAVTTLDYDKTIAEVIGTQKNRPESVRLLLFGDDGPKVRRVTNLYPSDVWYNHGTNRVATLTQEGSELAASYLEQKDYRTYLRWPMLTYQVMQSDYEWNFKNSVRYLESFVRNADCVFCANLLLKRLENHQPTPFNREAAEFLRASDVFAKDEAAERRMQQALDRLGYERTAGDVAHTDARRARTGEAPHSPRTATPHRGRVTGRLIAGESPLDFNPVALVIHGRWDRMESPFGEKQDFLDGANFVATGYTDGDGRFTFSDLPLGRKMYLLVKDVRRMLPADSEAVWSTMSPSAIQLTAEHSTEDLGSIGIYLKQPSNE